MPYDAALAVRVKAALARVSRTEEKKMFGALAFIVRGKTCVSVGRGRIMCRIDPAMHDAALRKCARTVVMRGREYRGFVYVDADGLRTKRELDYWVGLALDYNAKAEPSSRKGNAPKGGPGERS